MAWKYSISTTDLSGDYSAQPYWLAADDAMFCNFSGDAKVFAARGKRLCCRLHPHNQISNCYSYGYNDGISVDCKQYAKLGCKISEFHILPLQMPPPCTVPPVAEAPFAPPSLPAATV